MTPFTSIAYDHFGTSLLVSGERYEEGCDVTSITASDSSVDLFDLLPSALIQNIADRIDRQLSHEARRFNAIARAERQVAA